ncbi:HNH endonuclease [Planococcus wigleyi]|uniref:HNH endonuclease n=1 Tax=Planococcus wigleyi TaxID=2762216 RepID=A0ABR8W8P4_9BACL|nr:HNH endonuclease [Planococcus wigleyi]MBD8013388.1 HNH endonuclease [Planococcus wigleyi]
MGVLRFTVGGTAKILGKAANGLVGETGKLLSKRSPEAGEFLSDIGTSVINASVASIDTFSQFADGGIQTVYGAATKNKDTVQAGYEEMKAPISRTAMGIGKTVKYSVQNVSKTAGGLISGNIVEAKEGGKNLLKTAIVLGAAVGVIDVLDGSDTADAEELETRNHNLAGEEHPITGVPFEENSIYYEGTLHEGSFPVFEASFEAQLNEDQYLMSDVTHIQEANLQLYNAIQENPMLADSIGLTESEIMYLHTSMTPEGYDWHHHEELGKMQLVEEEVHQQTGHTGGREIWGGGAEFR